jgi:hypothetical protein
LIKEVTVTTTAAVEWKITIEGTDAFCQTTPGIDPLGGAKN